jgi:hypothetical protein
MMFLRYFALAIVLMTLGAAAYPQNAQTILPFDSPAISLLRSIYLERGKEPLSAAALYSSDEIQMMLDKIDPATLSEAGKRAWEQIESIVRPKPVTQPMQLQVALHPEASLEGYLHTNTDPDQTVWQKGYRDRLPMVAMPIEIWVGNGIYGFFDFSIRQGPDSLDPHLFPSNYLNWTTDLNTIDLEVPLRAFLAAGGSQWSFVIGRDRFSWGNGESGDLTVSDSPDYYDFTRIAAWWPNFKYTALWIMLDTNLEPYGTPSIWSALPALNAHDNLPRNFILHRFDFSLFDRVSISAIEGILIGGIAPDLVYFNPLMIFHDLNRWHSSSSIFALEANVNPWKYLELYGQAASNKLVPSIEIKRYGPGTASVANTYALLGGARSRVPVWQGYVDAGAEYTVVSPWMYLRENPLINYEWWRNLCSNVPGSPQWESAPLGYFTGPDSVVFMAWAGYDVQGSFSVSADYKLILAGQQSFSTPYVESPEAAALVAPSGIPEERNIVHVHGSLEPFAFLRLGADLYWLWFDNFNHVSGASMSDFQATLSLTMHADW